jgi:hypothetical protein
MIHRKQTSPVVVADCGGGDYLINQLTKYNKDNFSKPKILLRIS